MDSHWLTKYFCFSFSCCGVMNCMFPWGSMTGSDTLARFWVPMNDTNRAFGKSSATFCSVYPATFDAGSQKGPIEETNWKSLAMFNFADWHDGWGGGSKEENCTAMIQTSARLAALLWKCFQRKDGEQNLYFYLWCAWFQARCARSLQCNIYQ